MERIGFSTRRAANADHRSERAGWFLSFTADLFFPNAMVWGDVAATGTLDARSRAPRPHQHIVGAAVDANLVLLTLDIAWDRQARDRFVKTNAKKTLKARPSTG